MTDTTVDTFPCSDNSQLTLWQLPGKERKERVLFPWRRLFARGVDLCVYTLLWWSIAYFVFHWNVMLFHWFTRSCIIFGISFAIMLVLEPLPLRIFGTTPGKALFGMKLRNKDGKKLSLKQGYERVYNVFSRGCGYVVIPVYNFVRMFKSCKLCQVTGAVEWDAEEDIRYTYRGDFRVAIAVNIVFLALIMASVVAVYFAADMPRQRGDLTVAQFEENLEQYWAFHGEAWNTRLYTSIPLEFFEIPVGYIFDRMAPPEVHFTETNGVVTGVHFEIVNAPRAVLRVLDRWLRAYTVVFVGAQRDMNFYRMHASGGVLDTLLSPFFAIGGRSGADRVNFTAAGVDIFFEFNAGHRVNAYFRMSKT